MLTGLLDYPTIKTAGQGHTKCFSLTFETGGFVVEIVETQRRDTVKKVERRSEAAMREQRAGPRTFPRFEAVLWEGRLRVPPEYRGTPVRKQFESGRIGGKRINRTDRFEDTEEGRRALQEWWRRNLGAQAGAEVFYIRSPQHHKIRVHGQEIMAARFCQDGLSR